MQILIDTNILLWILFDDDKLKKEERKIIANTDNEIIISSISLFEISLKYSIKKLKLNNITPDQIPELLLSNGYEIENISFETFASFYKLPNEIHKDPFDRILIWEAINKKLLLLSRDSKFKSYKKYGLKSAL